MLETTLSKVLNHKVRYNNTEFLVENPVVAVQQAVAIRKSNACDVRIFRRYEDYDNKEKHVWTVVCTLYAEPSLSDYYSVQSFPYTAYLGLLHGHNVLSSIHQNTHLWERE